MFLCFLNFFKNVFVLFNVVFFVVVKTKTYKITIMMHFEFSISWAKTPFPGQSECFVAVLLTLFDSY